MCRNFDKSYLRIALEVGSRSYAVRHKVGSVIVKDDQIIARSCIPFCMMKEGYRRIPKQI